MNSLTKTWQELKNKSYREAYTQEQPTIDLAFQIWSLRRSRGWTEAELAQKCGWSKVRQVKIETVGGDALTWKTLQKLAAAFDVGLLVKFVPFSELVEAEEAFDPNTFTVPSFDKDSLLPIKTITIRAGYVLQRASEQHYRVMTAEKIASYRSSHRQSSINERGYNDFGKGRRGKNLTRFPKAKVGWFRRNIFELR